MKLNEHIEILRKLRFRYKKALASLIIDVMRQHYDKKRDALIDPINKLVIPIPTFLNRIIEPTDQPVEPLNKKAKQ